MFNNKIGLGTFPFSNVFSEVSNAEAARIMSRFLELGGSYIETAPVYPEAGIDLKNILNSHSRASFFLATKCVTGSDANGNKVRSGRRGFLEYQCNSELSRLGIEHLDLFQAHAIPEDTPVEEIADTLELLRRSGKVRFIGFSNVREEHIRRAATIAKIDFVQNRFSFIHRSEHHDILKACEQLDIKLNPYQVIERGQLTSVTQNLSGRRHGDLRNQKHEYIGDAYQVVRKWAQTKLQPIAESLEEPMGTIMLAWSISQPRIAVSVVGATNVAQLEANLRAQTVTLDESTLHDLDESYVELCQHVRESYGLSLEAFRGLK